MVGIYHFFVPSRPQTFSQSPSPTGAGSKMSPQWFGRHGSQQALSTRNSRRISCTFPWHPGQLTLKARDGGGVQEVEFSEQGELYESEVKTHVVARRPGGLHAQTQSNAIASSPKNPPRF